MSIQEKKIIGAQARVISPWAYHGLMTPGGSATISAFLSDSAIGFALANALGWMPNGPALPIQKELKKHWMQIPLRASFFECQDPRLLPPRAMKLNLDIEGGLQPRIQSVTASGNVKPFFSVQEVPVGLVYEGLLVGLDPFEELGVSEIVIRVGLRQNGQVLLTKKEPSPARLNASSAMLFERERDVGCEKYLLANMQASRLFAPTEALDELWRWQ